MLVGQALGIIIRTLHYTLISHMKEKSIYAKYGLEIVGIRKVISGITRILIINNIDAMC